MRLLIALLTVTLGAGCCDDKKGGSNCSIALTQPSIEGTTMIAEGTFETAQPLLVTERSGQMTVIPGFDDGQGHATFDLAPLEAGTYDYHFGASCYDSSHEAARVDAPSGHFTR